MTRVTTGVPPSLLPDPRAGGFARCFGSLAGCLATSSLITKPHDLPVSQTSKGVRIHSTSDEVLSHSVAVGPARRLFIADASSSTDASVFSAPSRPHTLHR